MEEVIRITIDGVVIDHWRVSEEQWEAIHALKKLGVLRENARIDKLKVTLMN